jgi:hypothetical protein
MKKDTKTISPVSQKQEDVLLELFFRLKTEDRKKVIRFCRDLLKASNGADRNGKTDRKK